MKNEKYTQDELEEFGRKAFYKGREIKRYDNRQRPIFIHSTYNEYLRELDKIQKKTHDKNKNFSGT